MSGLLGLCRPVEMRERTWRRRRVTIHQFSKRLRKYGIRASVGRTGVCWDNARAESFNATLKNERIHRMVYPTREHAIKNVTSWIERTYNEGYSWGVVGEYEG